MLYAYFDETGTHGTSLAVGVFGLIGAERAWDSLRKKWIARLAEDDIKLFHAFDCKRGKNEFRHWNNTKRNLLINDLAEIVGNSQLDQIGMGVGLADWRRITDPRFKNRYKTPYHFCFEGCILLAMGWSSDHANGKSTAAIFAEQDEYRELSIVLAEALLQVKKTC